MSLLLILCAYIIKSRTSNTYLVTKNDRHCQTVQGFGNNKKIGLFAFSQTCDNHVRITLIFMWYVYIEPRLNILSRKAIRHATKNKPKQLNWNFKWKEKQIWDFDFLSKIITSFFVTNELFCSRSQMDSHMTASWQPRSHTPHSHDWDSRSGNRARKQLVGK